MRNAFTSVSLFLAQQDKRTLLLILTILVLAAGAPCDLPPS